MGPADVGLWIAARLALQGDTVALGHMLFWGHQGADRGRELHVEGVAQLHGRLHIEVTEEGAGVSGPRVRDGEPRALNVNARVWCHLVGANRQQFLGPSACWLLLDDEFVPPG